MVVVNEVLDVFEKMFNTKPSTQNNIDISSLLTNKFDYVRETKHIYNSDVGLGPFQLQDIESRTIEVPCKQTKKENMFTTIINDCKNPPKKQEEGPTEKFNRLLLKKQEPSDDNPDDETIDVLIKRILKQNANYNKQIHNMNANSKIHWTSFYKSIDEKKISDAEVETIIQSNIDTNLLNKIDSLFDSLKVMDANQIEIYYEMNAMLPKLN
jgi:hypothetical protein